MDSYFLRFLLRGLVELGWIFSNVRRQREIASSVERSGLQVMIRLISSEQPGARQELLRGSGPEFVQRGLM